MTAKNIPPEIQQSALEIIKRFNQTVLKNSVQYVPRIKGAFLHLDRKDYGSTSSEICRLKYVGSLEKWEFAIFKHSSDRYDPDEFMFPGADLFDGSIEGAMRCGMKAYPA